MKNYLVIKNHMINAHFSIMLLAMDGIRKKGGFLCFKINKNKKHRRGKNIRSFITTVSKHCV